MTHQVDQSQNICIGAIEAGGTKINCAIATVGGEILNQCRFPTRDPKVTIQELISFFQDSVPSEASLSALGIGTFGPIGLNPKCSNYGKILATPKEGWQGTDLITPFERAFPDLRVSIDTDVNAAVYGEGQQGAAKGLDSYIYVTIGTGIGGGIVVDKQILRGRLHPEIGHISIYKEKSDVYEGACSFHDNCIEGLASGEAIMGRWGERAEYLVADHPAWKLEAKYIASLCVTLTASYSPERIILGGGVMEQTHLLPLIEDEFILKAGGYWDIPNKYLVTPALGKQSGIVGAIQLAMKA